MRQKYIIGRRKEVLEKAAKVHLVGIIPLSLYRGPNSDSAAWSFRNTAISLHFGT